MLGEIGHKILRKLPAEMAHKIGVWAMENELAVPGRFFSGELIDLFGTPIDNYLALAAGYDKYARLADHANSYGFAWIEEGSFTYHGGNGNHGRRLFRLPNGLLNRMGLNCLPALRAAEKLKKARGPFATSIAKTHNPEIVGDKAIHDITDSYRALRNLGIYTAINVSCPNTKEGKTFEQDHSALKELFSEIDIMNRFEHPLIIKLSPNLDLDNLERIVAAIDEYVHGYQIGNTLPMQHSQYGRGGYSGPDLLGHAIPSIMLLRKMTEKTILGCGGIRTGNDLASYLSAGAKAVLAFEGFVSDSGGPNFAHRVNKEYEELESNAKAVARL